MNGRRTILVAVLVVAVAVALPRAFPAERPPPADPKLEAVYRHLQFGRMFPTNAVAFLQDRLQTADPAVKELAELVKDKDHDVRALVALLLGELGQPEGAEPLWTMLQDENEFVRVSAMGALVRLSTFTPIKISLVGLKDKRADVRRFTAATLDALHDTSAEAALIDTLRDPDAMVRMETAKALGSCGTEACVPSLIESLHDSSVLVRTWAAKSLAGWSDPAVTTALLDALKDPDWHVRASATMSLASQASITPGTRAAISGPLISKLQSDEFALVRDRAADSLGEGDDAKEVAALVRAILSDNREARIHAARSIMVKKAVLALPSLMPHRHDLNPDIRKNIIEVFGAIGGDDQVPAIMEALEDKDVSVRLAAVSALQNLQQRTNAGALLPKISDTNAHVRAAAARLLGDLGDRTAVPNLIRLLRDSNGFVRGAAAEALGKLGDRSAIAPLLGVLTGEQKAGQTAAEEGLVIGGGSTELPEVARLKLVEERIGVVRALADLKAAEAVEAIVQYGLKADDAGVRAESAVSLGKIGEPKAVPSLQAAVKPYYEASVTEQELEEGHVIASRSVNDSMRTMKEKEARVRASVAWALGQLRDPSALPTLARATNDVNSLVREAAVEALEKIAEKQERTAALPPPPTAPTAPTAPAAPQ